MPLCPPGSQTTQELGFTGGEDRADLTKAQPWCCLEPWRGGGQHRAGQPLAVIPAGFCSQSCQAPAGTAGTCPGLLPANPYRQWDSGLFVS